MSNKHGVRVAFLASGEPIHTARWAHDMARRGYDIHVITMHAPKPGNAFDKAIKLYKLPFSPPHGYVLNAIRVKTLLRRLRPALLHTHYAGGYGTLSKLAGFHPTLLSVWGSDVFIAPYASRWKGKVIRANLNAPDYLASTSVAMKKETERLIGTGKPIALTPFGVDCSVFQPQNGDASRKACTIGTVKTLEPAYGIEYLVKAFAIVVKRNPDHPLRLLIVGGGSSRRRLEQLAVELGIGDLAEFTGEVPAHHVPDYLQRLSVFVCLSISESFGVSVLEASACGVPAVVADVGGLPEVVKGGVTGLIVPRQDANAAAAAIEQLITNPILASSMGKAGREFVTNNYDRELVAGIMDQLYRRILREANPCNS